MQEEKEQKSPEAPGEEATSSETLKDVEETEKVSDEASTDNSSSSGSTAPSPDGVFDEGGRGDSPQDDPGPM